ncbi:MAG: hypothetical protein K8L97_25125 [Anaerolineae bacterium]|nr:hypothetical protein [Anaerolineae bacterium]
MRTCPNCGNQGERGRISAVANDQEVDQILAGCHCAGCGHIWQQWEAYDSDNEEWSAEAYDLPECKGCHRLTHTVVNGLCSTCSGDF